MIKQGFIFTLMFVVLYATSLAWASEAGNRPIGVQPLPFAVVELFTSEG